MKHTLRDIRGGFFYGDALNQKADFLGFDKTLPDVLSALREAGSSAIEQGLKDNYDRICVHPCLEFISAIGSRLAKLDPAHTAIAEAGMSFRNRQENAVSTSAAHLSYLHLVFWAGEAALVSPTLHLVLSSGGLGVGAGQWQFDPDQLKRFHSALMNEAELTGLLEAIASAKKGGCHLEKPQLKTSPIDGLLSVQARQLSLHTGLVVRNRNEKYPTEMFSEECVDMVCDRFSLLLPLQKWLMKNVY